MTLWIVLTLMTVVAAVGLTIPLVRRYDRSRHVGGVASVLGEQLQAIDVDRENLAPGDIESLRADVGRRLLSEAPAAAPAPRPIGAKGLVALGIGLVAVVGLAVSLLYAKVGRPDLATSSPPADRPAGGSPHQGMDSAALVAQLEARMRRAPNDPDGWRLLGWSYMRGGRYTEAATAYGRALALDPSNVEFLSAEGEALTQAAGGQVTPPALAVFKSAIAQDKNDPRSRFYLALNKDQTGDHAAALADWITLLKDAPPNAPWVADVRGAVERIAAKRGEDVSARLPAPAPASAASADTAAALRQTTPNDQMAMIRGMVGRLDAHLKANPRDPNGWVQLMRARMVLGDAVAALAAYHRATAAYADSPAQQAEFTAAAKDLQIPGA